MEEITDDVLLGIQVILKDKLVDSIFYRSRTKYYLEIVGKNRIVQLNIDGDMLIIESTSDFDRDCINISAFDLRTPDIMQKVYEHVTSRYGGFNAKTKS